MDQRRRTVLVTGASSGIGLATAEILGRRGYRVLAGVRSERGREAVLAGGDANVQPVWLDVTSTEDVQRIVGEIRACSPEGLYALVNNAGIGPPAAVELSNIEEVRSVLEVNTLAPLRMIQACLPALRRGRGRVVNMSSMNGTLALPMVGAYSASKFALEALSNALRVELRPWGIPISVIRPGQVSTAIFEKARAKLEQRSREIPGELVAGYEKLYARAARFNERGARVGAKPEAVARVVLKAINAKRPKPCYTIGLDVRGLHLLQSIIPTRWLDGLLASFAGAVVRREPQSSWGDADRGPLPETPASPISPR